MAKNIETTLEDIKYTCIVGETEIEMYVPVGGEHFVSNSLLSPY